MRGRRAQMFKLAEWVVDARERRSPDDVEALCNMIDAAIRKSDRIKVVCGVDRGPDNTERDLGNWDAAHDIDGAILAEFERIESAASHALDPEDGGGGREPDNL